MGYRGKQPTAREWIGCVVLLAWGIDALGCSRQSRLIRKTQLARLPSSVGSIAVADDATSYAYVEKKDGGGWVVHDGVAGSLFPTFGALTFSPVTRRVFYWAGGRVDDADEGFLVADGTKLGGDFAREATIVFSRDGRHWATAGPTRNRREGDVAGPGPVTALADGRELGRYADASLPTFSPDGRHLAYLVAGPDGRARLIVDATERAAYAVPEAECAARMKPRASGPNPNFWPQFQVQYLSDGRLLVMTRDGDGWGIYRNGVRLASYEASVVQSHPTLGEKCATVTAVSAWSFVAADKAPVAAWWERLQGRECRWRVVVDAKPADDVLCAKAWDRQPPALSADGRHVAYACAVTEPEERVFMVVDGHRYGPYRDVWAYAWSDDGAHVAFGAADASPEKPWRYYVDGKPRSEALSAVWRPRVEAGTGHLAWEAEPEQEGRGVLGIERRRIASFDEVVWGPTFLRRGTVTWVIRRGRRLIRIDAPTA